MEAQVAEDAKAERLAGLQQLLRAQQDRFNRAQLGQELQVLFESFGRHDGQLLGRSPYLQSVHAAAPAALIGRTARLRIAEVLPNSLRGEMPGGGLQSDSARDGEPARL